MSRKLASVVLAATACLALTAAPAGSADKTDARIARGKYLVTIASCTDCHTPGSMLGQPDMQRFLGGSDVGFAIPGLGVFVPRNLTPDKETGLGNWTTKEIVTALTTGVRPDGRILAPIMPWQAYSHLTKRDALAIAAYLESLPPVKHEVPGPFGASEKPTVMVMPIVSADQYLSLPKPPAQAAK
jgi:mono/diheme cytochrome c family protein